MFGIAGTVELSTFCPGTGTWNRLQDGIVDALRGKCKLGSPQQRKGNNYQSHERRNAVAGRHDWTLAFFTDVVGCRADGVPLTTRMRLRLRAQLPP